MSDVAFTCPQCGYNYQFAAHMAGKRGRCKTCQAIFRIPAPAPIVIGPASATPTRPTASPPPRPQPTRSADEGKVVFNCPTCGHGYRLDAKLAGKQGRCTTCRGVFTIPAKSTAAAGTRAPSSHRHAVEPDRPTRIVAIDAVPARGQTRPDTAPFGGPVPRGTDVLPPGAAPTAAGDSGWWELDSAESILTTGHPTATPAGAENAVWAIPDDDEPEATSTPVRSKGVVYASIAAGTIVGAIAYLLTYSLISGALRPGTPTVVEQPKDQPKDQPAPTEPPPAVAEATEPKSSPPPVARPTGPAILHREAVDALIRAYNEIADGYARIRDAGSIRAGNAPVSHGVAELRSAAKRGRSLPPLSPAERQALIRHAGPGLLQAVDRVLGELRRLQATPGLRSDFGGLIAAYTRTREEIQIEVDQP